MDLPSILGRIELRLKALDMSAAAASKASGKVDCIRNMQRAVEEDQGRQGVSTATIAALAPVLKTTPQWILTGTGTEDTDSPSLQGSAFFMEWRKYKEIPFEEAAERLEILPIDLENLEARITPYDEDILGRLSTVYGCDPEDLLAINPLAPDAPHLVYSKIRNADPALQRQILNVVEAMLKAS